MGISYKDKGKFFTHIITKDPVNAIIQTLTHRIQGTIYVRRGERLLDELSAAGQFLAVTDSVVYNSSGKPIYSAEFITINRDQIVWLMPAEEPEELPSVSGGGA
jgi:hypothetical protein